MKVFISHSQSFDYTKELYKPLKESDLNIKHEFSFPHENNGTVNTKEVIKNSDLVLAEVSFPSTGQGIELGWANIFNIPILCISKDGEKISSSLGQITDRFIDYTGSDDMIKKIKAEI